MITLFYFDSDNLLLDLSRKSIQFKKSNYSVYFGKMFYVPDLQEGIKYYCGNLGLKGVSPTFPTKSMLRQ